MKQFAALFIVLGLSNAALAESAKSCRASMTTADGALEKTVQELSEFHEAIRHQADPKQKTLSQSTFKKKLNQAIEVYGEQVKGLLKEAVASRQPHTDGEREQSQKALEDTKKDLNEALRGKSGKFTELASMLLGPQSIHYLDQHSVLMHQAGELLKFDAVTGQVVKRYPTFEEWGVSVSIMPDGKHAIVARMNYLQKINLDTGESQIVKTFWRISTIFSRGTYSIHKNKVSPDGKWVALTELEKGVYLYNASDLKFVKRFKNKGKDYLKKIEYSADSRFLLSVNTSLPVKIYDLTAMKETAIEGTAGARSAAFSAGSDRVYVVDAKGELQVFDIASKTLSPVSTGFIAQDVALSRDGTKLILTRSNEDKKASIDAPDVIVVDTASSQVVASHAMVSEDKHDFMILVPKQGNKISVIASAGSNSPIGDRLFDIDTQLGFMVEVPTGFVDHFCNLANKAEGAAISPDGKKVWLFWRLYNPWGPQSHGQSNGARGIE